MCPLDELEPYIQDALDLIEFANGPADSTWGAKRAAMGHPEPFNLKMLGVGNEQWGQQYIDRYATIRQGASRRNIPTSSSFPPPARRRRTTVSNLPGRNCANCTPTSLTNIATRNPDWFFDNTHRYDNYDRNGPKVFMGEYAAQSVAVVSTKNRNNLECALAEAAYMTGLERNADVVRMASYAPLFANTEAWQWTPDLIWVDSLHVSRTPNYYVQQLFSRNRGDVVLPAEISDATPRLFTSAVRDDQTGDVILKVVNGSEVPASVEIKLAGATKVDEQAKVTVLSSANVHDENRIGRPETVKPVESSEAISGGDFTRRFEPWSLTVLRVKAK